MRRRDVVVRLGYLALMGSMVATAARAQPPEADRAKLRAEVVRLRAEVEMLQLDYDLARSDLIDNLKIAKEAARTTGVMAVLDVITGPSNPAGDAKKAEMQAGKIAEDAKKTEAEVAAYVAERKKELARLASSLASKRLDLEDAERRYREPGPSAKLGDRAIRDAMERLHPSLVGPSPRPDFEPASRDDVNRTPILDPVPGDPTVCCLDPPGEAEVWQKVPKTESGPFGSERKNARVAIEKIGQKVDPCKVYPLAGPCQLIHCHYKATVTFEETAFYPPQLTIMTLPRKEVVYLDKDYLRRCGDATHAHAARPRDAKVVRAALPVSDSDTERRTTRMEEKLDRILKALDRSDPGR